MDIITALALSIGLLGGIATFLFLSPIGMGLSIWAAFIGWASFYGAGGKQAGLMASIAANIWGAIVAFVALLLITKTGLAASLGLPLWAAIVVAITVVVLILGAKLPALAAIPSAVYGYASTVAFALLVKDGLASLTSGTLGNPLINIVLSMIIGNIFGFISEKGAGMLVKK